MVELEHPAQAFAAGDLTFKLANVIDGIDEFVIEPLVIAFSVIMCNRTPQPFLALALPWGFA